MSFQNCSLGMVVGPHPVTAAAGVEALRAGGNAFDAVVAAAFAEAVVQPAHNGVAGYGGSAVGFLAAERRVVCVDYNSEAPAAAHPEMYPIEEREDGSFTIPGSVHCHGALSVGVPGVVGGLDEIHRSWGALPLARLLAPAIRAARGGWECNPATHIALKNNAARLREAFPETHALVMPEGRVQEPGDRMANPELGETLERLAGSGLREFYEGELAARIAASLQEQGGVLTREDMAHYRARRVEATRLEYRGREIFTPPVGSGGITSFQILRVLEGFDLEELPGADGFFHLYAEVLKACWRRRLTTLGDPEHTGIDERAELEEGLIERLRAEARTGLERPRDEAPVAPDPARCTSQICAADRAGNVISLTQTHGGHFGSLVSVPGTGLIFGHGMARFEPRPGWTNSVAPRKRPLHNMAPMLALAGGRPVALYGTPGGRTIVNNQAYFSLSLFRFGNDITTTLALPRLHIEDTEPLKLEERAGAEVAAALRERGHRVETVEKNGGPAHGIVVGAGEGEFEGATDPRWHGRVEAA